MAFVPIAEIDSLTAAFAKLTIRRARVCSAGLLRPLPEELINQILNMIVHRSDQAALSLVCKSLHALVVPMLYHTVVLEVGDRTRFDSFVKARAGHRHLRNLTLIPSRDDAVLAESMLRLISILPQDTLRTFSCASLTPQLRRFFPDLSRSQHALENAIVVDEYANWPSTERKRIWHLHWCKALTLSVNFKWPHNAGTPHLSNIAEELSTLTNLRSLEELEVTFDPFAVGNCRRCATHHVLERLGLFPFGSSGEGWVHRYCTTGMAANKLHTMHLQHAVFPVGLLSLEPTVRLLFQNLGQLTTLVLQECTYCGVLLKTIACAGSRICLKQLVVVGGVELPEDHENSFLNTISSMLMQFSGLETLIISDAEGLVVPFADAIANHSATLKELYIDSPIPIDSTFDRAWYHRVLKTCTSLEQVALPMPSIRLGDKATQIWEFRMCLDFYVHLPKLVTLRVLDVQRGNPSMKPAAVIKLADFLAAFVSRAFKSDKQKELSVIALGRSGGLKGSTRDNLLCYVVKNSKRNWRLDGESGVVRMEKTKAMIEEPRSEILDIQQSKRGFLRYPRPR